MNRIRLAKVACIVGTFCLASMFAAQAQTLTTIANLSSREHLLGGFTQGDDGNLLGIDEGGANGGGAVIRTGLNGDLTNLYSFCQQANCLNGFSPAGIFQTVDGTIYGTTVMGGANGKGAVFELSPKGKETVLYSFCSQPNCSDGWNPYAGPVLSVKGGLLGTTFGGGANGQGILFELTSTGEVTTLYSFCAQPNCSDGAGPVAPPIQLADGTIYGTTNWGGKYGAGSVYAFTPNGRLVTMYSFTSLNGFSAAPTLTQGADGSFYGVTFSRGLAHKGSVFRITREGQFTTLYSFCMTNCADGEYPTWMRQGSDGNFYGMTSNGGSNGGGTIFEITPQGVLTTLYGFCQQPRCLDGDGPQGLVQDTNGTFYGTTAAGGTLGFGTAFSLSVGLGSFVQANPGFGKVGGEIGILGSSLTGTTRVTFNSTNASFKVVSDTFLRATVPSGATSGTIEVTTSSGTLKSNLAFQVLP